MTRAASGHLLCHFVGQTSKLFNALIHPKLWLEPPCDCRMLHQQQLAPFINLMGFIFLTLAIYQAEAAWWGVKGGSNSPSPASAQQGNHWFMVPLPFHITLFLSYLFPSLPAVLCLLSILSPSILMFSIKLPSFHPHSLWLLPTPHSLPLFPLLHLLLFSYLCSFPSFSSTPTFFIPYSIFLLSVTGLWGRWLPVHHQGDNHPHGELQLSRLRLWRPLSDTCAAGEWSVVVHFLLKVVGEVGTECFNFICATLHFPCVGVLFMAFSANSETPQ